MRTAAVILAFVSSAFAYTVVTPNPTTGWTNQGAQPLSWTKVDTDKSNFTAILDNQSVKGFTPQVLAALVDGTTGKTTLNPPSGGWPTGSHFRVNLVQDPNNLSTIYAQSQEFNITSSTASTTKATTTGTGVSVTAGSPTGGSGSGSTDASQPTDSTVPPKNGAASITINTGALAMLSLLAVYLA